MMGFRDRIMLRIGRSLCVKVSIYKSGNRKTNNVSPIIIILIIDIPINIRQNRHSVNTLLHLSIVDLYYLLCITQTIDPLTTYV